MVGELGGPGQPMRRFSWHPKLRGNCRLLSFSPVFGSRSGWLHDLSRRDPDAPPGVLELLVTTAVEQFRARGRATAFWFHPFTSLETRPMRSPGTARW